MKKIFLTDDVGVYTCCDERRANEYHQAVRGTGVGAKAIEEYPETLILHENVDNDFLLTWHGKNWHVNDGYDSIIHRRNFIDSYQENKDEHRFDIMFETRGMFFVTKEQAKILLFDPYTEKFADTLKEILSSDNLMKRELETKEAIRKRKEFLDNDYKLAWKAMRQHNVKVKKKKNEASKSFLEEQKETRQGYIDTKRFMAFLDKFQTK
ncbi:MAG: hypothetical protein J6Y53_05375 [Alphaproteobacteria bacterium]|nr:hypothetical protein [Alphaproteobacteria bacterium]